MSLKEKIRQRIVTPKMVEAGLCALWPCELRPYQDEDEVMAKVFFAMLEAEQDEQE